MEDKNFDLAWIISDWGLSIQEDTYMGYRHICVNWKHLVSVSFKIIYNEV